LKNLIQKLIKEKCDILVGNTAVDDHSMHSLLPTTPNTPISLTDTQPPIEEYTAYSTEQLSVQGLDLKASSKAFLKKKMFDTLSTEAKKRLPEELFILTESAIKPPPRPFGGRKVCSTIERVFSDPKQFSNLFIDFLELTIDLDQKQCDALVELLSKWSKSSKQVKKIRIKNPKEVCYRHKFVIQDATGSCLTIFYNPLGVGEQDKEKREKGNYNRLTKLSYNPSKVNNDCLGELLGYIEEACGNEFSSLIEGSFITRYDVTIDIEGIYPAEFISRKKGCSVTKRYFSSSGEVLTAVEGTDGYNRVCIYDKREDIINKAKKRRDFDEVKRLRKLKPLTRIEITYRPHKDKEIRGTTLGMHRRLKLPFECIEIYDGEKLFDLPILQPFIDYVKNNGLNSLRKNLSNSDRNKLKRHISKAEIEVDHDALYLLQFRQFKKIKEYLLKSRR
jgi:hypothetical protein